MADFHQPSDEDPGFLEFEGYSRSPARDQRGLSSGAFGSMDPLGPAQASGHTDGYLRWQNYPQPQPQINAYSAPQLHAPPTTTNSYIRSYHSGPMALSGQFPVLDAPRMPSTNDPQTVLNMNMNFNQQGPRAPAQTLYPSSLSGFSTTSAHLSTEPKDLVPYDNWHSQEVMQGSQISHARGQKFYPSSTPGSRKRPRAQNGDDWSTVDGDNGTGQMQAVNNAVQKLSFEDEAEAIDFIERWIRKYSAKDPPRPSDIDALASLARLPVPEVNRLMVQILWRKSHPQKPSIEAALRGGGDANAANHFQQLPTLQNNLRPSIFDDAFLLLRRRAQKCPPKQYMNLPSRDPTKIYQCTLGCDEALERKADWIRHEIERNYLQEAWLCNIQTTSTVNGATTCAYCHVKDPPMDHATNAHDGHPFCHTKSLKARIFIRKSKFVTHCNKFHPSLDSTEQADRAHFWVHSQFPSYCGFCEKIGDYVTYHDRFEHIAEHFKAGEDMRAWKQSHSQASEDDDSDGDDEDNNDEQNNSHENGEQNGGNLGDQGPQYYPPSSNYHSGDSGYNSKGSGQPSSNNTGSSFGSRHNTQLAAGMNFPPLSVPQASLEEHPHLSSKVGKLIGPQHQSSEGNLNLQEVSGTDLVISSAKPLTKSVMGDDIKGSYKDLCIKDTTVLENSHRLAHRPWHSQMRGNLQKLKDRVLSKLSLPGGSKRNSIKDKINQSSSVTSRNEFPSGEAYDQQSLFPPTSSVASSATLIVASLEQELSRALIIQSNRKLFLPISALDALVTEDAIERELRRTIPEFALERPHLPSEIARTSRKLFAILTYLEKGSLITAFLDEHITDSDLPLALVGQENQGLLSKVFANMRPRDINDFCRVQWYFLAPIFDRLHEHYELDDNVVLPFIKNEESSAQQGGYSEVWEVKIHPAHQQLRSSLVVGKEPSFATKRLFSRYPEEFEREAGMLKEVSKLKHRHLLELLMTYKLKGRYHLVFPYAKCNLRQLWNNVPIVDNAERVAWSLQQIRGLASGLEQIHCFTPSSFKSSLLPILSPESNSPIVEKDERIYGRHGDLKPENILWFANEEGKGDHVEGLLVIADFGLGRFHRLESRSRVDPATIGGTVTYAPPEVQLGSSVSRAYDIWSLGCVYLEFVTWIAAGRQGLIAFGDARAEVGHDYLEDDLFYTVVHDNPKQPKAIVRQGVQNWINDLQEKPNCPAIIRELLELISHRMLRVDPRERISSEQLNWKLSQMLERATLDPNYLANSKSEELSRPKDETQQHDAPSQHGTDAVNLITVLDTAFSRPKVETKQVAASPNCMDLVKYNPIFGYKSASDIPLWVFGITCERDCSLVSRDLRKLGRASYEMTPTDLDLNRS